MSKNGLDKDLQMMIRPPGLSFDGSSPTLLIGQPLLFHCMLRFNFTTSQTLRHADARLHGPSVRYSSGPVCASAHSSSSALTLRY